MALATYIDPGRYREWSWEYLDAGLGRRTWDTPRIAPHDVVIWLTLDNSDTGKSTPPSNMSDDKITVRVHLGAEESR